MKALTKLYYKSELWFALAWIIGYCILASTGDNLSEAVGLRKVFTVPVLMVLCIIALIFTYKNKLLRKFGLCKTGVSCSAMLYYIPVLVLLTANLWHGVKHNGSLLETVLYILSMFCVGFLEELIFRGFLFQSMKKNGLQSAIIVSSITFGIGHIINLFNGSGAQLLPNILQVVYAIAVGFMFVMIYCRTSSLITCILTHSIFNALSVFSNEDALSTKERIISCVFITLLAGAYAVYLAITAKNQKI